MRLLMSFVLAHLLADYRVESFSLKRNDFSHRMTTQSHPMWRLNAVQQDEEKTTSVEEIAARLRKEAEMMRLQAEKMDLSLTLQKIQALEAKLQNKAWLTKHSEQEEDLKSQLKILNDKLSRNNESTSSVKETPTRKFLSNVGSKGGATGEPDISSFKKDDKTVNTIESKPSKKKLNLPKIPLAGFDDSDLELYIPVAKDINKMAPNATIEEKLELFRTAPELKKHFEDKIKKILVGPLEDMKRLEALRNEYLDSASSKERERLKREIERLEQSVEDGGPFMYSEGFYCDSLNPLTEEELSQRMAAVGALPDILIAIYKQRTGLGEHEDLSLAIQLDYYEPQLQLLEQARMVTPFTDEMREEYYKGFNLLSKPVQERFAIKAGLDKDSDVKAVLKAMLLEDITLSPLMRVVETSNAQPDPPEYNDIDFVDRSRFLEEFYPAIGDVEGEHPPEVYVQQFASEVLDKRFFMVTSKPERVSGGYYIRGANKLSDDEGGSLTAADKLVAKVSKRLQSSSLADKLEFYYILDPSPPTDEEMEFGPVDRPLFLITSMKPDKIYKCAQPLTKTTITLTGLLSTLMFSIGACALNPAIYDRFNASLKSTETTGILDLQWFSDLCFPIFFSLVAIQFSHELAHRIVAWKYTFDTGFPNIIPSITTGITGAITPLKSPPPNLKSMFDFGIAGPLTGLTVSLVLLLSGLVMTVTMALNSQLPVVPVDLLRSSSLGGGLVEFFLGKVALMPNQGPGGVLQLHPLAIAGFIGCITNAVALLPLGHTDGGRIAVAMFGRRGAFVVKLFTTLLLCVAGLIGLDNMNIFLAYALYASIWQRELETPARNEVDELDFPRGLLGIATAIIVGLVLIPML